MPNSYNVNQLNLLVSQLALKKHLKTGDSIFLDNQYLNHVETILKNHQIKYEILPLSSGYEIKVS